MCVKLSLKVRVWGEKQVTDLNKKSVDIWLRILYCPCTRRISPRRFVFHRWNRNWKHLLLGNLDWCFGLTSETPKLVGHCHGFFWRIICDSLNCVCVFFVWSRNCMVNIVLDTQYTILIQFDCPFVIAPNIFFQAKIWTLGKSGRPTKNGMYRYPWSPGGQRWRGCFPSNYHVPSLLESPTWGSNFWAANQTKVNINSICSIMYRHCIVMPNFRHGAKTKWSNCELFICLFAICVFVCWLRNVSRDLRNLLNIFLIKWRNWLRCSLCYSPWPCLLE